MRVTFLGRSADVADIPITDDTDGPEAKALNARVEAICRYAREHVIDARAPDQPPELLRMPDERQVLTVGPLRCVYVHSITPKGRFQQLTIGVPGAPGVPPPEHCAVIAKMFGFTGEIQKDYFAEPRACECPKPGCRSVGVVCVQAIPQEAS